MLIKYKHYQNTKKKHITTFSILSIWHVSMGVFNVL